MASFINTNIASLNAQRNLTTSQSSLNTSLQRLSSGLRVNSAKDDAAGLAIADRMSSEIRGNTVAMRNANDGISMAQTAEGSLAKIGDNLQRMRELAVQAANGTNTADNRTALNTEFSELQAEVTRVVGATTYNGVKVLASASDMKFQVGAGFDATTDAITVKGSDLSAAASTVAIAADAAVELNGTDETKALDAITKIDAALKEVNTRRTTYGAVQNRFEAVVSNLQTSVESASASRSRIVDADFASETANLTRGQILQQAGTAMLAQANSLPNGVLSLLRG
jgi:flagellin